jgi:outer membrane receptor protein involved in Fe transport
MILKNAVLIIFLLFSSLPAFPQNTGSIKGVVKEKGSPVEYVNVFLTLQEDTAGIITGAVTDGSGTFLLEHLPFRDYLLHVQMVGFYKRKIPVAINENTQNVDLMDITIEADPQLLDAVEVKAMRNLIQKTEDGFVVNASDNITQAGGTAADLLKNMPGILVGAEGEITLRGKTPLTLINGRVSGIAGIERNTQLERIPASTIERIEIINNPSAKYDADAEGGIINIILKKSEDAGTNGAFAVGAGFGDRYRLNASLLMNHKTNVWNLGFAYDNWYTTRTRRVRGDRINYDLPDEYFLTQRRFDERLILYQNAKANIDYTPNDNNALKFEVLWAFPGEDNNETLVNTFETSESNFDSQNMRHSNEIRRSHALEFALNYVKKFEIPDRVLSVNISDAFGNDQENTDITTQTLSEQEMILGNARLQRTHTYQKTNLFNTAVDYSQQLAERAIIETGYKGIFRFLNADFERASQTGDEFIIDPLNSNIFEYHEQIHAVYGQYTSWTGNKDQPRLKYNIGLRAEQVWNNGANLDKTEEFRNDYFNLFPSGNLFYYTQERNNLKISYSRRINRPGLGQLNPFTDITDSLNQRAGNPKLKPELIHSIELGYNHSLKNGLISLTSFYRVRRDAILPYTVLDDNGVAFTQPFNFGNATTYGFELITSYNPFSRWSVNFSFSAYEVQIEDEGTVADLSTSQVNWYSKLINNFTLFRDSKLQVIASYSSPATIPQGESVAVYYVDLGIQQKIIRGKGRLGLTITDIFNTQEYGFITSDKNFHFSRIFKLDTQAVMITFGYTFGTSFKENLMENKFKNE